MNNISTAGSSGPNQAVLPLVIGVTGHRDLCQQDVAALEDAVRNCLRELRGICPNTPFVLLSPLAEGADRLVARVALAEGAKLVAPLPLPRAEYEKEFVHQGAPAATEQSMAEFDGLLKHATHYFELPLAAGNTPEGITIQGAQRDRQYLQVSAYIVRHSHILMALWDGETPQPEPVGGTGQIVRYALNGLPDEFSPTPNPLDAADAGPVVHIVTPRMRHPQPPRAAFSRQVLLPGALGSSEHRYSGGLASTPMAATLRRHDAYNADALSSASGFCIAVAAVFFFELYGHFLTRPSVLALYPLALLSGFAVYRYAHTRDFHGRHLDYRALAEGLRVQLFW